MFTAPLLLSMKHSCRQEHFPLQTEAPFFIAGTIFYVVVCYIAIAIILIVLRLI